METVKDRLIQFIEYKGINPHSFEKRCGLATSFVANMRNSMQPDKMMSIAQNFPDLNFDWLLLGRGSMLYENHEGLLSDERFRINPNKQNEGDFGSLMNILFRFLKNQEQYQAIMKGMVAIYERINKE